MLETLRSLLALEDSLFSIRASRAIAYIQLYKTLGGGWSSHSFVPPDRPALQRLGWQISGSGALLRLLGLLGGWWLAGRAIQPIDGISRTASRIAGGKLSERIDIAGTDNELSRLSQVLNDTFDRLAAAIERQREFTAGGEVWIRVFSGDQGATLEVVDRGPGMPRLFDRFYRIDPARGPSSGHSGL